MEADRRRTAVGRNGRNRPAQLVAAEHATIVGAARHVGRVGRNRVHHHHIGGIGETVVGHLDHIGEQLTGIGQPIVVGIGHRLDADQIGRRNRRWRTAIVDFTDRVTAVGVATGWAPIDQCDIGQFTHPHGDGIVDLDLEGYCCRAAVGREAR